MQYLLTHEEYSALLARADKGNKAPNATELQELCTAAANSIVLKDGWRAGEIWGCFLTAKHEWYCDDCPAQKVCPHPNKSWSK